MTGAKITNSPGKSERTPKKKRARPSTAYSGTAENAEASESRSTPKTPVRQKRRASDFASKKSSAKKRSRKQTTPRPASTAKKARRQEEPLDDNEASVDEVLQQVRELIRSESTKSKQRALAKALKRADKTFQNDISGSSSSEDEQSVERTERTVSSKLDVEKTSAKKAHISQVPTRGKEQTPRKAGKVIPEPKSARKPKSAKKIGRRMGGSSDDELDPARHRAEIEALKRDDPQFYKFLEENDGSLLDFDASESSGDEEVQENRGKDLADQEGIGESHNTPHDEEMDDAESETEEELELRATENGIGAQRDVDDGVSASDTDASEDDDSEGRADAEDKEMGTLNGEPAPDTGAMDDRVRDADEGDAEREADDVTGYSDSDDLSSEEEAEARAAAEAGLDVEEAKHDESDGEADVQPVRQKGSKKKMIFVDMKYLREIKELLKGKRSSLKACKDLLRIFRAGREILPTSPVPQSKKAREKSDKTRKKPDANKEALKELEDMAEDHFADDGSFTSGKVKFASARAYQQAMNLSIIGIQDALDAMLGKPRRKNETAESVYVKWDPKESGRWANLEEVFRPYVFHLLGLCEATEDPGTLRFLLKRLEKLVPYTVDNKVLLKKIIRIAVRVWSTDAHHVSETTRLRSYLLLVRLVHGPGNAEAVLRGCCNAFTSRIGAVCNAKTLPLIHFSTSCIVELFGIDMGASYTTAFSYLREMAVSLRAVLVSKNPKQEVERIHNWSYMNELRLFSKVLGRYGSEDELGPLVYPYVQVSLGMMRVQPTPRTYPLRLHIASYLSDLVGETGVFIPLVPHVLALLRCSELRKKPAHGSKAALEWRSLLRVSDEGVKTKPFLSGVVQGVVVEVAKYFATIAKHVSFPEIAHFAVVTLRKMSREMHDAEWRTRLAALAQKVDETAGVIVAARAKADLSPRGAVSGDGMLACVPGMDARRKMPIERFFEVERGRVAKEEALRDEKDAKGRGKGKGGGAEDGSGSDGDGDGDADGDAGTGVERGSKRERSGRTSGRTDRVRLSVPQVNGSGDEADEVGELSLDSDDGDGAASE